MDGRKGGGEGVTAVIGRAFCQHVGMGNFRGRQAEGEMGGGVDTGATGE
jgi:hypothetical protein